MPRKRRVTRDQAERLLAAGSDPAQPDLSRLLAAASAPPRPHELAGLDAALAAFERAGWDERPVPAPRRRRLLRPLVAVAAASVALVGGVAVAAETGYLPGADPQPARESTESRDAPSSASRTSPGGANGPVGTPGATTSQPAAKDLTKLCRTWERRLAKDQKPMKPEELSELARAAGGEDRIAAFCAPLLKPSGKPSVTHGPPTARPSASHPTPPNPPTNPPTNPPAREGKGTDGGPAS